VKAPWIKAARVRRVEELRGRKGHLLVGALGLVLAIVVYPADIEDHDDAKALLQNVKARLPRLHLIWPDGVYRGQWIASVKETRDWLFLTVRWPAAAKGRSPARVSF